MTGFLHPPHDLDAMAASGIALLTDRAHHQAITSAALTAVLQRFCANVIVPQYEAFYVDVLSRQMTTAFTP